MEHLIADFDNATDESDMTHVDEVLALHDLSRDAPAGNFESFKRRSLDNAVNRGLHHHVFDTKLAVNAIEYSGMDILEIKVFPRSTLLSLQKKRPSSSPEAGSQYHVGGQTFINGFRAKSTVSGLELIPKSPEYATVLYPAGFARIS